MYQGFQQLLRMGTKKRVRASAFKSSELRAGAILCWATNLDGERRFVGRRAWRICVPVAELAPDFAVAHRVCFKADRDVCSLPLHELVKQLRRAVGKRRRSASARKSLSIHTPAAIPAVTLLRLAGQAQRVVRALRPWLQPLKEVHVQYFPLAALDHRNDAFNVTKPACNATTDRGVIPTRTNRPASWVGRGESFCQSPTPQLDHKRPINEVVNNGIELGCCTKLHEYWALLELGLNPRPRR
jgi:hypothetical protein